MKIKKNDKVKIISGDDKGKFGTVLEILPKKGLIKVQGIALIKKHFKAKSNDERSGIRIKERFIHISNVAMDIDAA